MATLLLLSLALGVHVCSHVTLPLSSRHPSIQQKKNLPKNPGGAWMGGEECWTWAGRGGAGSPLLPSSLSCMSMCCLMVAHGLAGGCLRAQIQTVPGVSRMCWDCPWEHFVSSQRGWLSSCLAPAWHGKEEALLGKTVSSCLLAKPGPRSWHWSQPCKGSCVEPGAGTG